MQLLVGLEVLLDQGGVQVGVVGVVVESTIMVVLVIRIVLITALIILIINITHPTIPPTVPLPTRLKRILPRPSAPTPPHLPLHHRSVKRVQFREP